VAFEPFVENSEGSLLADPIIMSDTATTDSSGNFSLDITGISYTSVSTVHATTKDTASGVTNTTVTSVTGFSTSTVSGSVYQFTETLGILNLSAVGSGRTVYITVIGSQTV
jgi:hypothetical protein